MGGKGVLSQEDTLEIGSEYEFSNPYIQLMKDGLPFYKPDVFHLSPTICTSSVSQEQQGDCQELASIVSSNGNSVPLITNQIEQLKSMKETYPKTFVCSDLPRIMLYGNWPVKNVCMLGKVTNIITPQASDQTKRVSPIRLGELPHGKIKENEYVVTIEDGTSANAVIVRMNSETWNDMQQQSCEYQIMIGSKMKVWGMLSFIFESMELLSSKAVLVGTPNNLKIETEWWKLCLKAKRILDCPWVLRPLAGIEQPSIDLALSFISFQNIIEIDDTEAAFQTVWVTDLDCSFNDFLDISLSQTLHIPNNFDILLVVFEYLVDSSIAGNDLIRFNDLQNDKKIIQVLHKAIISSMLVNWHTVINDSEILLRWKLTKFTDCTLLILNKCIDNLISLKLLVEPVKESYSLNPLSKLIAGVNTVLNTVEINKHLTNSTLKVKLSRKLETLETFHLFEMLFTKCIDYNTNTTGKFWQKVPDGWKRIGDPNMLPSLCINGVCELHNQIQMPDIELLKCSILLLILSSSSQPSLDSIMNSQDIKKILNKLILGEIYGTCGNIDSMYKLIDVLASNRNVFVPMKKKIVAAIIFVLHQSNIIEIIYDGYLDIHCLSDYEFSTILIASSLARIDLPNSLSSSFKIETSQMKKEWKIKGFELNTALANCVIYCYLASRKQRWNFDSSNGVWTNAYVM